MVGLVPQADSSKMSEQAARDVLRSEKSNLTAHDPHSIPVELSHNETIEVFVVGAAIVPQEPKRLLFADEEAADAVGAVMDPGGVAAERDVVGQLVDLIAEGEFGAEPRSRRRTVSRGFDRMRQNVRCGAGSFALRTYPHCLLAACFSLWMFTILLVDPGERLPRRPGGTRERAWRSKG